MPLNPEQQQLLPLLPLDDRVILPHMTVPVAVDSETARAALLAARQTDGLLVLVPRVDGRFARLGTVAHVEESGRLPDGRQASVVRGLYRGVLNSAATEREGPLWMTVEPAPDAAKALLTYLSSADAAAAYDACQIGSPAKDAATSASWVRCASTHPARHRSGVPESSTGNTRLAITPSTG